jgi:L-2-hydroxyglutarate oxidase
MKHIAVIGGGIVGLATAYKLTLKYKDYTISLLEKEAEVCEHQSSHNSGVLHSGLYYKPNSLKAILSTKGIKEMIAFCEEHHIAYEQCGKLVVATNDKEEATLQKLFESGTQNGLSGLKFVNKDQIKDYEPHVVGQKALHVPEEGIVNYKKVGQKLAELFTKNGGQIHYNFKFDHVLQKGTKSILVAENGQTLEVDYTINCGGLYSDVITKKFGIETDIQIIPFRGDYYHLKPSGAHLVQHLIYPVPDIEYPFLGVHFTRMIEGGVEVGPNAVLAFKREGYKFSDLNLSELVGALGFKGLRKFLAQHKGMVYDEMKSSLFKSVFLSRLQKMVPEIQEEHIEKGLAGVRAQAMREDGLMVQDFALTHNAYSLHVINAPSPGATSSLAIADYIIDQMHIL